MKTDVFDYVNKFLQKVSTVDQDFTLLISFLMANNE